MDDFLFYNLTSPEQECIPFHKSDIGGVDDNNDVTPQQAAVREEFASSTKNRQQERTVAGSTEPNKQFDSGQITMKPLLF